VSIASDPGCSCTEAYSICSVVGLSLFMFSSVN
jgi:hypothetical protein